MHAREFFDTIVKKIYTEDMNNGQVIEDTLMIVNPFISTKNT